MKEFLKRSVMHILTTEARLLLARKKPRIIAIVGSVGKTSTKDTIYTVLKNAVRVRKNEKSFNTEIGVPLTVLGLTNAWSNPVGWTKNILEGAALALFSHDYPEWLVLELGVDRPGDMKRVARWIRPDILVLTRFPDVPVHVEYFETPEALVEEKLEILSALKDNGVVVFNNDDERIRKAAAGIRQRTLSFSRYSPADFAASGDKIVYESGMPVGFDFTLISDSAETPVRVNGALGVQHAYNYASAIAVGSLLGIEQEAAVNSLLSHMPPPGRMRLIPGLKGSMLIDDSYNASPAATEHAILSLGEIRSTGRKFAVLGDMLELGRYSIEEHEKIGKIAAEHADVLMTVGIRARECAKGALDRGMPEENIFQYEDAREAGKELEMKIKQGDIVLLKGSQSIRMERAVEEVMAEPARAEEMLCRQDAAWRGRE